MTLSSEEESTAFPSVTPETPFNTKESEAYADQTLYPSFALATLDATEESYAISPSERTSLISEDEEETVSDSVTEADRAIEPDGDVFFPQEARDKNGRSNRGRKRVFFIRAPF